METINKLHRNITQTNSIVSVMETNFCEGCEGYHSITEDNVASLLWQVKNNLAEIKKLVDESYREHKAAIEV